MRVNQLLFKLVKVSLESDMANQDGE
jgi:hypothetical protein